MERGTLSASLTYAVGIVNYRNYTDLESCLRSVKAQSVAPVRVVVIDNDSDPLQLDRMRERHAEVEWKPSDNTGYAGAANRILDHLSRVGCPADFFLILNPDTDLEPSFAERLLWELAECEVAVLASGKLLRPTGEIDSAGIELPRHRRPRDRGSEKPDRGQYERTEFVFGATGAALMIRRAALEDLAINGEVFDEDFFAYYEETDLAWRANLLGWRVLYVPAARAWHRRRWRRSQRFQIEVSVRRHSFKNHYLQMIKNERPWAFLRDLPVIVGWELLRLGYAVVRDREVLGGYVEAWRHSKNAWRKRRVLQQRVRERTPARRAREEASLASDEHHQASTSRT